MDPVIFSIDIFGFTLSVRWYGVLLMTGVVVGSFLAAKEIERRGGDGDWVWEGLVWVIPAGIVGARLWFVLADILATIDCYYAWPSDRERYPFKPFSRWLRHDFDKWVCRAADDADYRRAVHDSQADPLPLRAADPETLAGIPHKRPPPTYTRQRDTRNRPTSLRGFST